MLVLELDLPDDNPNALQDVAAAVGQPPHATQMHAAIREDADRVLAIFTEETP